MGLYRLIGWKSTCSAFPSVRCFLASVCWQSVWISTKIHKLGICIDEYTKKNIEYIYKYTVITRRKAKLICHSIVAYKHNQLNVYMHNARGTCLHIHKCFDNVCTYRATRSRFIHKIFRARLLASTLHFRRKLSFTIKLAFSSQDWWRLRTLYYRSRRRWVPFKGCMRSWLCVRRVDVRCIYLIG